MQYKIALAGNPNSGKTTLFNALTGSAQYVGNWPGVTVEKKDGKLKGHNDVIIQDLPGIYSLSPYTLEEVVSRRYLVTEKPDAILNIIDGTNIERNLYLTTQLIELGIPVLVCVNMMDLVRKNGDKVDLDKLSKELGCQVLPISALKGEGCIEAAEKALKIAEKHKTVDMPHVFTGSVEHAIAHIEESISLMVDQNFLRWYAIKIFERDEDVLDTLKIDADLLEHLEEHIKDCETELDDEAESIITNQRYAYISKIVSSAVVKKERRENLTISDKIDTSNFYRGYVAGILYRHVYSGCNGNRLDQRCALWRYCTACSFRILRRHWLCRLAGWLNCRWCGCRCRCSARICTADVSTVHFAGVPGKLRLHGKNCFHHG